MIKKISTASVLMALSVVCLLIGSSTTITIAMLFMASALLCIVIMECGIRYSLLTYIGVSVISLLIIPKKAPVYIYALFLGYYPIIKLYVEKIKKLPLEWLLKIVIFNAILLTAYIIFKLFLMPAFDSEIVTLVFSHLSLVVIILEVAFVFYDVLMSYVISFYLQRVQPLINILK